jgi:phenylalanyl-tRNA synthetase beta subunit
VPKGAFEISYPLAADKAALREKLAPKVFESLAMNARNVDLLGLGAIKIFEIGKVFPKTGEKTSIAIGVAQVRKIKGVTSESLLKEALVLFEEKSGAKLEVKFESKGGYAVAEGDIVAREGGAVSKLLGVISELNFIPLSRDIRYKSFSQYPFITRDIAFFVLSGTRADEVAVTIRKAATDAAGDLLVKGPDLFDQFEKEGKLSLAFRMIFQSFERTLSDEEVNVFMTKIYEAAKSKGWQVR